MKKASEGIHKILIVNLGGIGDVLLSIPALRGLRKRYPSAQMVFLGVARACEFMRGQGLFDEAVLFPSYDEGKRRFLFSKMTDALRILLRLRKNKFDLAINMRTIVSWPSSLKMALMFYSIGARSRAGRNTCHRGFFFDVKVWETDEGEKHEMDYDLELVRLLGAEALAEDIGLQGSREDDARVEELFLKNGIKAGDKVVGFHVGGIESHRWPLENFAQVIDRLDQEGAGSFVITGGKGEEGLFEGLASRTRVRLVNAIGRTSLGELIALIRRCDLFISNDTGAMHLAAALGRPLVAIFGAASLKRYDPRRISDKAVVIYRKISCAPCLKNSCSSLACLRQVSPEEVVTAAHKATLL